MTLYAVVGGTRVALDTVETPDPVPAGWTSEQISFTAHYGPATVNNDGLELVADDDGTGTGVVAECFEEDNGDRYVGPVCE